MKDFLEYILYEVKNKRLLKADAVDLIHQFQMKTVSKHDLLHPLLQQNTSDLSRQCFSSSFTGMEFFLKDHIVKGQRVLPGVAYLEMARAAVKLAAGPLMEGKTGMRLKNVVWARPIAVGERTVQVHIELSSEENGEIAYEIYSQPEDDAEEAVIHSQGSAVFTNFIEKKEMLDLGALKMECSQSILSSTQCYEAFSKMGIAYGPGHQGIETLFLGADKIVAKLTLPSSVMDTQDQFILHPSIMDSALQASMGLMIGSGSLKPALPFALQELELMEACTSSMWAVVRYSPGSKGEDKVQKLDIDLCNEEGTVCVRMKGFSARILEGEIDSGAKEQIGMLRYQPVWKEEQAIVETTASPYLQHVVMLCELKESIQEDLENHLPGVRCITLQAEQKNIEERFLSYTEQVFQEVKKILENKPKGQVLLQLVICSQQEQRLFSGLSGLLKTAHLENSKLIGQVIEVEDTEQLAEKLQKESSMSSINSHIRYQDGKRWVAEWKEMKDTQDTVKIPWKDQGVYLITGGAGGLGLSFAQDIARQAKSATIILTGRSALTQEMQTKWQGIVTLGARVEYRQADVTDQQAVSRLIEKIQEEFGGLHGILHCAGVIRDNFILKKTQEEMQEVLSPKVLGLVNLDQAAKDMKLDFFILFSSIAGSLGNAGQADYAAANAFMDAYAEYRNDLAARQQRHGKTLSMNWPLWQDGGMGVDEATKEMMMRSMGMIALQTASGIQALYQSIGDGKNQVMVMEGKMMRMRQKLLAVTNPIPVQAKISSESDANGQIDSSQLLGKIENALMQAVSQLLKVKLSDIDISTELSEYGFDSITFTEFANKLNQDYKMELTPTVFFEYPTIQSFAEYLTEEYRSLLASQFLASDKADCLEQPVVNEPKENLKNKRQHSQFARMMPPVLANTEESDKEPIAIVGMAGKFPKAKDVNEFWENLLEGRDCIAEIPPGRWDWREYYGDPAKEVNKTNIKWGGFIDGVEEFDPLFFGISPREAELMDPQQRLLMTYVWKVIEDAGYSPQDLSGTETGIFVGTGSSGYDGLISKANVAIEGYSSTGIVPSVGPNRMSYLLNLHGPSEPIETACSSSLVAIHRAVQALESGACEMAIAGGVNTLVTPDLYISFNKAGMLAEDGRCKTFSDQANGYVRGEGAGMLLLKKLKDAESAGDHIYGIIKGTAENHGGRANSLTAPNPKAQAKLLETAYTKAGIDPRTVTYIEAHGTGTELGDPIEINGLKAAFKELYEATGDAEVTNSHCGLGSVKTNIGHLELAAGVAGVIKVLLQLQHKTLVKSLHCDKVNPYIQLTDSPFYIVQEKREWKSLQDETGKEIPRRGGVSSFGFGGVNAHVVIEEYIPPRRKQESIPINDHNPALIVLSARNEERLKEQAQQLLRAIKEEGFSDCHLADMAYTLQIGREAMEERLAVMAGSIKELEEKLQSFVTGQDNNGLYRGQVKRSKDTVAIFTADEDLEKAVDAWISKRKYEKILNLWVKGLALDWNKIYGAAKPQRISLPTYPFARESYWIPKKELQFAASTIAKLTPLLHRNTSTFSEQRFSSTFTGQDFFLKDYSVKGKRIFSEAAYLEMAREAVSQAAGFSKGQMEIRLSNVLWMQPFVFSEEEFDMHIELIPEESGQIAFEIYGQPGGKNKEAIVYSLGTAVLNGVPGKSMPLDLADLQVQCSGRCFNASQCYEALAGIGIDCGPGYQGIEAVYAGTKQVLAQLTLSPCVLDTHDQFVLHPSLLNSAIWASIGFMMDSEECETRLPAALQELEILGPCSPAMWAWIRYSEGSAAAASLQQFDIDLCDTQGKVCIRMKGLEMQGDTEESTSGDSVEVARQSMAVPKKQEAFEMMTFEETWQEQALSNRGPAKIRTLVCFLSNAENQNKAAEELQTLDPQTKILFISQHPNHTASSHTIYSISRKDPSSYEQAFQSIREEYGEIDGMLYLWPIEDATCIEDYSVIVYLLQSIAAVKLKARRVLLGAQFETGLERCYLDSWIGFERSLGLVLPNTQVAVMYQKSSGPDAKSTMEDWLTKLWSELETEKLQSVFYQGGKRYVYQVQETFLETGSSLLQAGGTYLITGGCGGLGFLFARHFAKTHGANLILTGRSALDEEKQAKIRELEALGSHALYLQADSCDVSSMKTALGEAKAKYGKIHGVIHAAGLAGSQSLFEKDLAGFSKIIEPKIKGTLVLDEVLQEEALHFMCYFSSSSAILGDFGSCDYAIGNRFQMAYANYRQEKQLEGKAYGKSLVINWPLWKDGGMGVGEEENSKLYLKSSGQRFLEAEEGVGIFDQLLTQNKTQHLIVVGERSRVQRFLRLSSQEQPVIAAATISMSGRPGRRAEMKGFTLEQCIEWDLKEQASQLLKIPRDKLEQDENLADFGFDSISLAQFAGILTNHYSIEFTPSLFFGYSTLEKLKKYFLIEYQETMKEYYQESAAEDISEKVPVIVMASKRQAAKKSRFARQKTVLALQEQEPIAIIGMSGRFPEARTVDEMWQILAAGKDVIQDFPADRFSGKGKSPYQYGAIPGVSEFDPLFFEISPREAESMDPRQRLLLQESWKALEDAGYGSAQIQKSKIGMFVGVEEGDYRLLLKEKSSITSNHNAVLSARLAYFLNLSGPNMAINTACSSGLVAVHQACQSIRQQECDTALAAGVNLLLTPQMFQGMSEAGMLSEDGKCFAFDKRANGMVPAEAVAVVVLKRLSQAKADKDPIYAVIKGSGINYDGKTNGITAPSGASQTKLLKSVYDQYQINPEDLEYIVTHGTGTKLGDPIEVNALYDAFKDYTKKQGYCALTSTKTNFGHALAASGLVSLISLVQAFRHETIPASLHFQEENEYIHWSGSPFYVNKESKAWPEQEEKRRMGGVSAFGMSGTNVHMVLESYSENRIEVQKPFPCYLLAFSAKTQESLQEKCKEMIVCLETEKAKSLGEISFTLLEGRQHFAHRCAVVVQDKEDGIYVLQQMGSKEKLPNLFKGTVARDFTGQKAIEEYGQELLAQSFSQQADINRYKEILHALADLYCQGYDLAWRQLYGEEKLNRLHLPGYPFAKESYWVPEMESSLTDRSHLGSATVLHPLLQQNTSDFSEQRFSSSFTGEEFFLKDHVVKGQRILPGVAYLEMVRAAAQQTAGALMEEKTGMRLKDIIWAQPIVVEEEAAQVHIGLFQKENGEISYEIYSQMKDNVKEAVIHNQGSIALVSYLEERKVLDLKALQAECSQGTLSAAQCYKRLKAAGVEYDTRYQGIESVYLGVDQVLAKLMIPSSILDTQEQFNLHPCLLDSVMQVIGLQMAAECCRPAAIIALQELAIIGQYISAPWVRICRDRKSERFDVDFCDDQGMVYMQMKGLEIQAYTEEMNMIPSETNSLYPEIHNSQYPVAQGRRAEMKGFTLEQCIDWDLKEQVSQLLKISRDKLDREENLAEFGFDSISLSEFAGIITDHYSIEFTPALFFGYSTLKSLTQYFLTEYQDVMQLHYREAVMEEGRQVVQAVPAATLPSKRQTSTQSRFMNKSVCQEIQEQEPIAIIGMSGRFPEARTVDEMWQILAAGKDVIQDFPADRFSGKGKSPYQYGAIPGVSEFDPLFFEISPREAESMDPRQRLLLQESWKALEDAGYGSAQIQKSKIGMFVGVEEGDYRLLLKEKSSITSNHNAVLSARLAYFLNLSGPNMAINTACSSGLVAVHQACQSIRQQECDTALAAGVNLLLTPQMFQGMSEAGMLSEDGKCFAFDKRANGMVPAEAVAVVVLKRLSQAKADKDPIYAVIKGSGINYDGKTNGITAPSGASQTKLLKSVYDQYQINPEDLEYIVTHGTGTKLGDPIEVNALYDAFKDYTKKQGYCALTSTKTNFGHALAASGLVSLISLVQAFRHETIPASLHFQEENEYIHWSGSPFYVNKESKAWPEQEEKRRMGGVSAFGMSGTNVHMVLESYSENRIEVQKPFPCYLLAFSAKTQESLQEKCKEMIVCLETEKAKSLGEISFTLLEGRQHFAHRCAVVVQDKEDGIYVLQQMGSKEKLPNLFKGTVARDFTGQKAIEEYGQELLAQSFSQQADINRYKEILHALADLYCQGYDLAWRQLYGEEKPNRLHLPGYPFAKESYWTSGSGSPFVSIGCERENLVLHPLLQQNTSDFSEQRFSSSFTGEEFFLKDHVVKGQRILPGVAYLEMARAAAQQAAGRSGKENVGIQMKHVVWARPMLAGEEAVQVHIGLFPEENGEIAYEIYSHLDESLEEAVVHSQGTILLRPACEVQLLPIEQIRNQCSRGMLSSCQCYEQLRKMGLEYGPGHQGIETLYIGDNQVLAKLLLPAFLLDTQDQFILHPSIMDSALQASMGLMIGSGSLKPALPFALQELELMEACTPSMWAVVRYSPGSKGEDKVQKLDIDLCNEEGTVCVRMKGFSARILEREIDSREKIDMLLYQPGWKEKSIDRAAAAPHIDQHVVILCEPDQGIQESMAMNMNGVRCIALQRKRGSIAVRFQKYADEIFEEIRAILKEKTNSKALIQIVIFSKEQMPFSGFSGLLKTAHLENARLVGQIIEAEPEDSAQSIREKLIENSHQPFDSHIRYQDGKRWIAEWKEMKDTQDTVKIPWKDEGVYLITGGAGGLGLIFAQDIARQAKSATIILTGRSALTQEMQTKWQGIVTLGARVEYRQADVTDQQAVSRLIEKIQEEFGGLHGILHCAGVIRDNFILKKTQEEMQEVLSPKVLGLVNLDQAAKDMKLDVFILFSSIAGSLGNAGQADYAAANAFMDAYAEYRNDLAARQQRQGKTLSINWPLWQEGGMGVDEITKKIMMQNMGMIALQTANGIQALYQSIGPGQNQVMVMAGKADQLRMALEQNHPDERGEHSSVYAAAGDKIINQDLYQKLFDEIAAGVLSEEEFSTLMKV